MASTSAGADAFPVREEVVSSTGVELAARQTGDPGAAPILVLHGLFATRDHVLMGSTRLEEAGYRVISYDLRGHGRSGAPATADGYGFDRLVEDAAAVMDAFDAPRAVLLGVSAGAHTALRLALEQPERVAALAVVMPAYDPDDHPGDERMRKAEKLAVGLRRNGVQGFMDGLEPPPAWGARADTFRKVLGRRMNQHRDLEAVADSLDPLLTNRPFGTLEELRAIDVPTLVVGARDAYEGDHPYALAERYTAIIPGARLVCEPEGKMPLAWNGGALAAQVLELAGGAAPL